MKFQDLPEGAFFRFPHPTLAHRVFLKKRGEHECPAIYVTDSPGVDARAKPEDEVEQLTSVALTYTVSSTVTIDVVKP